MKLKFKSIPKKSGGTRQILCQPKRMKMELRDLLVNSLNYKQIKYCDDKIFHGFLPCRSVVSNAQAHIGYNWSWCIDIKDFFDSIRPHHIEDYLSPEEISKCFIDGRAYQGMSTSPCMGNLSLVKAAEEIKELTKDKNIVFSIYADNISFSFNNYDDYIFLKANIENIINKYGFELNNKKSWLQDARYGNRNITGVMVGKDKLSLSRKFRRILRAAKHKQTLSVPGLEEWAKLRFPHKHLPEEQLINLYNSAKLDYNAQMFKNHNSPIVNDLKKVVDRLSNYNTDPMRRDKEYVKAIVSGELNNWKKITKEKLKLVSRQPIREKLKAELEKEKLAEISLDVC
jgi:hypothetical protein